jgi:hypothetical protein
MTPRVQPPTPQTPSPVPQADGDPGSQRHVAPKRAPHSSHDEGDEHIGAVENQVAPTSPPSPDDDEPKQG